jgi:NitT/TauT family transport system substrate-binding protein
MRRRTLIKTSTLLTLSALTTAALGSCQKTSNSPEATDKSGKAPLRVGMVPWVGWSEFHIAEAKDFFAEEGVAVEQTIFQTVTEVNTALLSGQLDMAGLVASDLVVLSDSTPGLKFIYSSDYSGEVDAIVGRNVTKASELAGKTLAREEVPYEIVFVAKFLESAGLSASDVNVVPLTAADGAAALAAEDVDAVATYEPFITTATKASPNNTILFTAADSNIIINGLAAPDTLLKSRRDDVLAYLRAIEKANAFLKSNPDESHKIVAEVVGITPEEVAGLMGKVKKLDMAQNKTLAFAPDNNLNVISSINAAAPILVEAKLAKKATAGADLVDPSFVNAL